MTALLLLLGPLAHASELVLAGDFDETLAPPSPRFVTVDVVCGTVQTQASPRVTVRLQGDVGPDGRLHVKRIGDRLHVSVRQIRERGNGNVRLCTNLTIELPASADVNVDTVSAEVTVEGSQGRAKVETVSGNQTIGAGAREAVVESVSGEIRVGATREGLTVSTVSGNIVAEGIEGALKAESVSGSLSVTGRFSRADIETVSGSVQLLAQLQPPGELEVTSHSGDVGVIVPSDLDASFALETYSGRILVDDTVVPKRSRGPGQTHRLLRGRGVGVVEITTFSGDAVLQSR